MLYFEQGSHISEILVSLHVPLQQGVTAKFKVHFTGMCAAQYVVVIKSTGHPEHPHTSLPAERLLYPVFTRYL